MKKYSTIKNELKQLQIELFRRFAKDFNGIYTKEHPCKEGKVSLYQENNTWVYEHEYLDAVSKSTLAESHIFQYGIPASVVDAIFTLYDRLEEQRRDEEDESDFDN